MSVDLINRDEICRLHGAFKLDIADTDIIGIAGNVFEGVLPINGLRHPPEGGTSGWYIWGGTEFSEDADFFRPSHYIHLKEMAPFVDKFFGLPPGWRFLAEPDYEDVWFDPSLLKYL